MNYTDLINKNIGMVYQKGIATKILQHMDRIRNVSDLSLARRWVMELFQNSRDVSYKDQSVKIRIELKDTTLSFSHNGQPFRVKDILSIINQVSSKNPDENTIGQFGTGFMTTYQLSEEVEIQSILKEEDLPYKPFSIHINRRGISQEEILKEIENTMAELKQADQCAEVAFEKNNYNTTFIYHLDNQESYNIAKTGMDDLKNTILYVLLFSEKIEMVELLYNTTEENKTILYQRQGKEEFGQELSVLHIRCLDSDMTEESIRSLVYSENDGLTLAAEWNEYTGFVPFSENTPKLFVDFPLIGAENFPFPIVINHRGFHTNEPRSGIALVDNIASRDSVINKEIMEQAVKAYKQYLSQVVAKDCRGIEHIVKMPEWELNKEHSSSWVKGRLYMQLYKIIASQPFIETEQGMYALNAEELYLISGETEEEKDTLKQLVGALKQHIVAIGTIDWFSVFSPFLEYGFSKEKTIFLETILENASSYLSEKLDEQKMSAMEWIQTLYTISMKNETFATKIKAGSICIFPNQNKESWEQRQLWNILQVKKDPGIPEVLKDVCESLDCLNLSSKEEPLKIREVLLHSEFDALGILELQSYEITRMENHIIRRTNRNIKVLEYMWYSSTYEKAWHDAWYALIACGPDENMYQCCKMMYKEQLSEHYTLEMKFESSLWKNTYISILEEMLQKIESQKTLENLQKFLKIGKKEEIYSWLNSVIACTKEYLWDITFKSIFPNQKGTLRALYYLKKDEVQEELKTIIYQFDNEVDHDIYTVLLDTSIISDNLNLTPYTDKEVAGKIDSMVQRLLVRQNLASAPLKYQEACTKLLGWIQEHLELAKNYFPSFCSEENQMKLLTPKAAVHIQKKANAFQKLMDDAGVKSPEELLGKVEQLEEEVQKKLKELEETEKKLKWLEENQDKDVSWEQESDLRNGNGMYLEDVFYGDDIVCADIEKEAVLRKIGVEGEKYAFQQMKQYFLEKGYQITKETEHEICMVKEDVDMQTVTIEYPDNALYHQAGWDIKVELIDKEQNKTVYYIEVKTHTLKSKYKNVLVLSNEQMKTAMNYLEQYVILKVSYDYNIQKGISLFAYQNIAKQIALNSFKNMEESYCFQLM